MHARTNAQTHTHTHMHTTVYTHPTSISQHLMHSRRHKNAAARSSSMPALPSAAKPLHPSLHLPGGGGAGRWPQERANQRALEAECCAPALTEAGAGEAHGPALEEASPSSPLGLEQSHLQLRPACKGVAGCLYLGSPPHALPVPQASLALGRAISLVSEAVASIVLHSDNDAFKEQCRGLAQVEECEPQCAAKSFTYFCIIITTFYI